jgi:ubiquitin C-terminal hydrolase
MTATNAHKIHRVGQGDLVSSRQVRNVVSFRESSYMHEADRAARQGAGKVATAMKDKGVGDVRDARNEELKNSVASVLFEKSRLDPYLQWPEIVTRVGPGLVNMGNTCFLNSVIQCLTHLSPLAGYLLSSDHTKYCPSKKHTTSSGMTIMMINVHDASNSMVPCIFCHIEQHVRECFPQYNNGSEKPSGMIKSHEPVRPLGIVSNLKAIAKHFRHGRQEDAHEFLCFLLEAMQRNFLQGVATRMKSSLTKSNAGDNSPLSPQIKETSVIYQIFGGRFQSSVTCPTCMHTSNTLDSFLDICLDIRHTNSLDQALEAFVKPEKLTKDNSYRCGKCKHMVNAEKRLLIREAPMVLTIQLKRFTYHPMHMGGGDSKITKILPFPETLVLDPYMVDEEVFASDTDDNAKSKTKRSADTKKTKSNHIYSLQGVLVHSGASCHSGHYYSFVRGPNDIWYSMNDSFVHPIGLTTVLRQPAYLLFYVKKQDQKLSESSTLSKAASVNQNSASINGDQVSPQCTSSIKNQDLQIPPKNLVGIQEQKRGPTKRIAQKISSWVEHPLVSPLDKRPASYDAEYDMGKLKRTKSSKNQISVYETNSSNPFQKISEQNSNRPKHQNGHSSSDKRHRRIRSRNLKNHKKL